MATQKKPASDSKDKPAAKKPRGVTFDVVPPSKVMPSATARPVITSSGPQQPDNTLTQPGSAPLMHKQLVLKPSGEAEAAKPAATTNQEAEKVAADLGAALDDLENKAPTAPEVPAVLGGSDEPIASKTEAKTDKPAGRSVTDLLSSKQSAVGPAPATEAEKAEAEVPVTPEAEPAPKVSTHGLTIKPISDSDKPADAETVAKSQPDEKTDGRTSEEIIPDDSQEGDRAEQEAQQAADTGTQLADLNDKGKDKLTDEPLPPPELYGGKPVIEIHEDNPLGSALKAILLFLLILGLALLALNFLLDAGVVSLGIDLPHTDILEP